MNKCPRCGNEQKDELLIDSKFSHIHVCCDCHSDEAEILKILKFLANPDKGAKVAKTLHTISFFSSQDTDTETAIRGLEQLCLNTCKNSGNIRLLSLEAEI